MEHIENETVRQHSEREQAWLELLESDCLLHITIGEQLKMAQAAKCYRVVEFLLEKCKQYENILNCYLQDTHRHMEIWQYIRKYADNAGRKIYQQIYDNFNKMLNINAEELTKLVIDHFSDKIIQLINLLDNNETSLFLFMNNLHKQHYSMDSDNSELYIKLLCQYAAEHVETYLRSTDNYRVDIALDIVRKFELYSSCIYLYEKQGYFRDAFNMALDLVKEAPESTAECRALEVSALCSRASQVLAESDREQLWFEFIKIILPRPDLTQITRNILHAASGHVDLTKLVQLILSSGVSTGNFGDIKHLLVGMLSNSKYETLLLETTTKVLGTDLHNLLVKEKRLATQGLAIKLIKCVVCRRQLYNQIDVVVFAMCGHAVHENCRTKDETNGELNLQCPRCGLAVSRADNVILSKPQNQFISKPEPSNSSSSSSSSVLQLDAPPRIGIGG